MIHGDEYAAGQVVYHKVFGKGRVFWVAVGAFGLDLQIDFEGHGRKQFVLAFARASLSTEPWPQ